MRKAERYTKARERLEQVRKAEDRVKGLEMQLESLRALATDTANHLSGMPGGGSADRDRTGRIMAEIDDRERRLATAKEEADEIREKAVMMICEISDYNIHTVLTEYYIRRKKWQEVAREIGYSINRVYQFRDMGLEQIEHCINEGAEAAAEREN